MLDASMSTSHHSLKELVGGVNLFKHHEAHDVARPTRGLYREKVERLFKAHLIGQAFGKTQDTVHDRLTVFICEHQSGIGASNSKYRCSVGPAGDHFLLEVTTYQIGPNQFATWR